VWSAQGPNDHGIFYGRNFVKGIVPIPFPGDVAGDLEAHGYYLTPYVEGEWFSHWEKDENHSFHQHPIFKPLTELIKPVSSGNGFPAVPEELPERLTDEWLWFFEKYTASGRLKKEYRGD